MNMGNLPRKGDCISWIGSCAQILANSNDRGKDEQGRYGD